MGQGNARDRARLGTLRAKVFSGPPSFAGSPGRRRERDAPRERGHNPGERGLHRPNPTLGLREAACKEESSVPENIDGGRSPRLLNIGIDLNPGTVRVTTLSGA